MFESAEIGHKIGKAAFSEAVLLLRAALLEAQADLYADKKIPVLLLISGQDGAGKGETVNVLYEWIDPRFMATVVFSQATGIRTRFASVFRTTCRARRRSRQAIA